MKKSLAIAALLCSAVAFADSGIAPYELNVKEFDELKVVDGINVEYFCNPEKAGLVAFEASPDVASAIIFEPNGKGKLEVKLAVRDQKYTNLPTVRVYSSYLTKIENDGDSTLNVVSLKEGPELEVKLVGNGRINVRGIKVARLNTSLATGKGTIVVDGSATEAKLSLWGTGEVDASDLLAKNISAKLMGTGWIKCWAIDKLNVSGMGTGAVSHKGNPAVSIKALKLKVKKLE